MHRFLYNRSERQFLSQLKLHNSVDKNIARFAPFTFSFANFSSAAERDREKYGVSDETFILLTAGKRVADDMKEDFITAVIGLLERNSKIVWYIIGSKNIEFISKEFAEHVASKRIVFIEFEAKLADFVKEIDVNAFVYPKTNGNGGTFWLMLQNEIPMFISQVDADFENLIDYSFLIDGDVNEQISEVEKVVKNPSILYEIKKVEREMYLRNSQRLFLDDAIKCAEELVREKRCYENG